MIQLILNQKKLMGLYFQQNRRVSSFYYSILTLSAFGEGFFSAKHKLFLKKNKNNLVYWFFDISLKRISKYTQYEKR